MARVQSKKAKPSPAAIGRRLYPQQTVDNPAPTQGDNGQPSQGMNSPMRAIMAALMLQQRLGSPVDPATQGALGMGMPLPPGMGM